MLYKVSNFVVIVLFSRNVFLLIRELLRTTVHKVIPAWFKSTYHAKSALRVHFNISVFSSVVTACTKCDILGHFLIKGAFFWAYSGTGMVGIKSTSCSFSGYSHSRVAVKPSITLLTGSDMSVINSGRKGRIILIIPAVPIPE